METYKEEEIGFCIREADQVKALTEVLNPSSQILYLGTATMTLVELNVSQSVHLYSHKTNWHSKERVRLRFKGRRLRLNLDHKFWLNGVKYESTVAKTCDPGKVVQILTGLGPIVASLAKERLSLRYAISGSSACRGHRLDVSLDKLVAFSLRDPVRGAPPAYHVEFEGDGSGSEKILANSSFFKTQLAGKLRPATRSDTKWKLASDCFESPQDREWRTYEDVLRFVEAAIALLR